MLCAGALARTEAAPGPPILNNNQPVQTSSRAITLSWAAPAGAVPLSYVVEASSAPGSSPDLANFDTGKGGIVGTPTSFDLFEIDFPPFSASSPRATTVTGTFSRPTAGGDSPQQPGGSSGTLTCNWSLSFR